MKTGIVLGALLLTAAPVEAQVTLQVWNGRAWTQSLEVTRIPPLSLRWSRRGAQEIRAAVWQASFAPAPAPKVQLPPQDLAGEEPAVVQAVQGFYPFQILARDLPDGLPPKFHVRVVVSPRGGPKEASNWVLISRIAAK